jgi:hypothetical protein
MGVHFNGDVRGTSIMVSAPGASSFENVTLAPPYVG